MRLPRKILAAIVAALGLVSTYGISRADESSWQIGARGLYTDFAERSDSIQLLGVPTDGIRTGDTWRAEVDAEYFLNPHFSGELSVGYPRSQAFTFSQPPGSSTGSFRELPLILTMKYRFLATGPVRPYLGLGINWNAFLECGSFDSERTYRTSEVARRTGLARGHRNAIRTALVRECGYQMVEVGLRCGPVLRESFSDVSGPDHGRSWDRLSIRRYTMKTLLNGIALATTLLFVGCGGITGNADCNFTVGGTITGLPSGLKFTLLYNGGNPQTISSSGPFTLTQLVTLGSIYSLTVGTQPSGYTCAVTEGSGTVTATQQSGVAISCAKAGVTLSGTIAGLGNVSGLSLTDGQGSISANPGATSFSFPTPLAAGTAYNISVASQPTGETCSVAGGSGTAGSANIANAVVTCSNKAFTLGGTIQGLTVSGLVLANGTDTLSVSSGTTTFTMLKSVAYTSSYALTVMTQPAGLACAVSHGTGTMPASNVNTIAISCTDQPFSLGGTITGLGSNTGLVLANGSDTLPVASNATTFTMPTSVPFGSAYAVSVQTSPAGTPLHGYNWQWDDAGDKCHQRCSYVRRSVLRRRRLGLGAHGIGIGARQWLRHSKCPRQLDRIYDANERRFR